MNALDWSSMSNEYFLLLIMLSNGKQFVIIYSSFQLANRIVERNDEICFFRGKFSIFSSLNMNTHRHSHSRTSEAMTTVYLFSLFLVSALTIQLNRDRCHLGRFHFADRQISSIEWINRIDISYRSIFYWCLFANELVFRLKISSSHFSSPPFLWHDKKGRLDL